MNAQKIADIPEQSLVQFLVALPASFEAQVFYMIVVCGCLGVFFHYAVKWMRKEIAGSLFKYLFRNNLRGTLLSATLTIGAGAAGIAIGMFEEAGGQFIGWYKALVLAFGNGFFWDVIANKGTRAVWTAEERAKRT